MTINKQSLCLVIGFGHWVWSLGVVIGFGHCVWALCLVVIGCGHWVRPLFGSLDIAMRARYDVEHNLGRELYIINQ